MKKALLLISLGAFTLSANAQSTDSASYSFSVKEAIEYALDHQSSVQNSKLNERIAKKKVNEITGMGLPQISATADVKNFIDIPTQVVPSFTTPGEFSALQFGLQHQAMAGIDVSQLIFSGDYFVGVQAAKVYKELAELDTKRTKIETATAVSKAYYTVLINEDRSTLLTSNIERIKTAMDGLEGLVHYGFAEQLEFDRLKVTHNNLISEQEKINRLLEVGRYLLKFQIGMEVNAKLSLTEKLDDVDLSITDSIIATPLEYENRVEYNMLSTQLRLAKLDLKRNRLASLPSAYAYGSYSQNAYRTAFNFFDKNESWYPTTLIGATITMPIFNGLRGHAKTQQAKLEIQKLDNSIDELKRGIDLEMASSVANLKNASQSLNHHKENIDLAARVVGITKMKFDRGVGTNLEIVTAESALKEAQTNYYNALFEAILAKIDYNKSIGQFNY